MLDRQSLAGLLATMREDSVDAQRTCGEALEGMDAPTEWPAHMVNQL